jgi:threonine/homoserine/homoserine lactone efflux protein
LAWLGIKQWRQAGKTLSAMTAGAQPQPGVPPAPMTATHASRYAVFRRGVLVACSNPKAILFFAAVFPHFMPPGPVQLGRFLLLSLTFVACTFVSHLSYVLLTASAGARFLAGRGMARVQRATGVMFILLAGALLR